MYYLSPVITIKAYSFMAINDFGYNLLSSLSGTSREGIVLHPHPLSGVEILEKLREVKLYMYNIGNN